MLDHVRPHVWGGGHPGHAARVRRAGRASQVRVWQAQATAFPAEDALRIDTATSLRIANHLSQHIH